MNVHGNQMVKLAINKSLLKEFGNNPRTVYMNDGDEFQIQLFNPENYVVGAKIYIDNESMSDSYIVLRPGERIWLDRHIDCARKLKFETYEVSGKSKAVQNAISNNGYVRVDFYKEYKRRLDFYVNPITVTCQDKPWWEDNQVICNGCDSVQSAASINSNDYSYATAQYTCAAASTMTAVDLANVKLKESGKIETGRVGKGDYSKQCFDTVNKQFESFSFCTETIRILPKSQKPVTSNDLHKMYCHECGRKIKNGFKFCPYCGARQ